MLKAIHRFNKKGFTLIELLIVVAIIAILAAIAIPQFSSYRKRGYNASANSDLRNARTAEEAMYADFQDYGVSTTGTDANGGHTGNAGVLTSSPTGYLCGNSSATTCQSITLSPTVNLVAHTDAAGTSKNSFFALATKHKAGDVIYGQASNLTQPYREPGTEGTILTTTAVGVAGPNFAFASPWTAMQ